MKPTLVALQEEAINLYLIICNYFRSNNPFVQTFSRSLLSRVRKREVEETGKSSREVSTELLLLCWHCPAKDNEGSQQLVSQSPVPRLARSPEGLGIPPDSLWAFHEVMDVCLYQQC